MNGKQLLCIQEAVPVDSAPLSVHLHLSEQLIFVYTRTQVRLLVCATTSTAVATVILLILLLLLLLRLLLSLLLLLQLLACELIYVFKLSDLIAVFISLLRANTCHTVPVLVCCVAAASCVQGSRYQVVSGPVCSIVT